MAASLGSKLFLGAAGLLGAALVVGGLSVIRTPSEMRVAKEDYLRISALRSLETRINNYSNSKGKLPPNLDALSEYDPVPTDPITGVDYGYRLQEDGDYQLCATFKGSDLEDGTPRQGSLYSEKWRHPAGEHCFTFAAQQPDSNVTND